MPSMAGKGEEARERAKDEAKVAVLELLEPFRDLVCINKVCLLARTRLRSANSSIFFRTSSLQGQLYRRLWIAIN